MVAPFSLRRDDIELKPACTPLDAAHAKPFARRLYQMFGTSRARGFPGVHPVSISRADLPRIQTERSMVALKSDGIRYMLMLAEIGGEFKAVMIDRTLRVYEVHVWANLDYYTDGTLLDGELVLDHSTSRMCYVVFDAIVVRGHRYHDAPYCDRLQAIHNHVLSDLPADAPEASEVAEQYVADEDKIYVPSCNHRRLRLVSKKFVPYERAHLLWEHRNESPYPTDGLIVNMNDCPIRTGTARSIFKWKPHNVVDVSVELLPTPRPFCRRNGSDEPLTSVRLHGGEYRVQLEDNHMLQCIAHRAEEGSRRWLVECLVKIGDDQEVVLWPMKERHDKNEANDRRVIEATLRTIDDAVAASELFATGAPAPPVAASDFGRVAPPSIVPPHETIGRQCKRRAASPPASEEATTGQRSAPEHADSVPGPVGMRTRARRGCGDRVPAQA